ncbi:hypothetical protein [Lysobacter sp. P5_B9]
MKSKYLRVTQAADEYFGGDFDLLTEIALARDLMVFARLSSESVRVAPLGQTKPPTDEEWQSFPPRVLTGHFPISWRQWPFVFTTGSATIDRVWVRDHTDCGDGPCKVGTFFDRPLNTQTDRIAWFDRPEIGNRYSLPMEAALVSRRQLERAVGYHFKADAATERPRSWPWGDYETSLLRHLAAAADRFWKNYDPAEPDTAETKVEVVKWLMARDVPERTAEYIDTILRAENLPKGPRRKK